MAFYDMFLLDLSEITANTNTNTDISSRLYLIYIRIQCWRQSACGQTDWQTDSQRADSTDRQTVSVRTDRQYRQTVSVRTVQTDSQRADSTDRQSACGQYRQEKYFQIQFNPSSWVCNGR